MRYLVHHHLYHLEPIGVWYAPAGEVPTCLYAPDVPAETVEHWSELLGYDRPHPEWSDRVDGRVASAPAIAWHLRDGDAPFGGLCFSSLDTDEPADEPLNPAAALAMAWQEWAGTDAAPDSSKGRAVARRLRFAGAIAPAVSRTVLADDPVDFVSSHRLPTTVVFHTNRDETALVCVAVSGEAPKVIDTALAWALIHGGDRDLHVVVPDTSRRLAGSVEERQVSATARRAALLEVPVRVWTYDTDGDGLDVRPVPLPTIDEIVAAAAAGAPANITHSLGDQASWVDTLVVRADNDERLTPAHRGSYLAWQANGRRVLVMKAVGGRVDIAAGTDSAASPATQVQLTSPLAPELVEELWDEVDAAVVDRLEGDDDGNLENQLQTLLADTEHGRQQMKLDKPVLREAAAYRPGQAVAYIDLLGVSPNSGYLRDGKRPPTIRVVETKLGLDEMLGLQGLDYAISALATREQIVAQLRELGHELPDRPRIVIDFVVGTTAGDGSEPDLRYLAPVVEAISGRFSWRVGTVTGWRTGQPKVAWRRPRWTGKVPNRIQPRRWRQHLDNHLIGHGQQHGTTSNLIFHDDPATGVLPRARPVLEELLAAGLGHRFLHHVRSSQAFALNLLAGLTHDQVTAIANSVDPRIVAADTPQFEWVDRADMLQEATRTSRHTTQIDTLIMGHHADGSRHALLVEVKLTESDFGHCTGRLDPANDRRDVCATTGPFGSDPEHCFKLRNHDRGQRRLYDLHLPVWEQPHDQPGCAFTDWAGQPSRQYALAHALVESGRARHATVVLCAHDDNPDAWRRWQQLADATAGDETVGIGHLPASTVLAQMEPDEAQSLAERYDLSLETN